MDDWSVTKTLVVCVCWVLGVLAVMIPITVAFGTGNTNADRHRDRIRSIRLEQERTCLAHPGYQWIDDNCVRTAP